MKTNIRTRPLYECDSCNIDNLDNEWCPCLREDCEAKHTGTIVVTAQRKLKNKNRGNNENNRNLGQSTII